MTVAPGLCGVWGCVCLTAGRVYDLSNPACQTVPVGEAVNLASWTKPAGVAGRSEFAANGAGAISLRNEISCGTRGATAKPSIENDANTKAVGFQTRVVPARLASRL